MASSSNLKKDQRARIIIIIVTILCTLAFILLAVFVKPGEKPNDKGGNNGNNNYTISGTLSMNNSGTSITVPKSGYIYYKFVPSSTGSYKFYSLSSSPRAEGEVSSYDPKAILYNYDWSQLKSDDNSGLGNNFSISYGLTSGTTYYLAIGQSGSVSSSINVTVYVETDNMPPNISEIDGYTVSGTLSTSKSGTSISVPKSGYIYYRFVPSLTGTYKFYSSSTSSSYDPKAVLYNSGWSQLASDDDSGLGNNFSISYRLTSGTTYYLAIGQSGSASSSISVTVYVE